MEAYMVWVWMAAMVVFGVVEAATTAMVCIWFAVGALAALVSAQLGAEIWVQAVVFVAVSVLALAASWPLVRRRIGAKMVPTNADRILGQTGRVTEEIDNARPSGAVYIDGKTWSARSAGGGVIQSGAAVRVRSIEGVKLMVEPAEQTQKQAKTETEVV